MMDKDISFKYTKAEILKIFRQYYFRMTLICLTISFVLFLCNSYSINRENDPFVIVVYTIAGISLLFAGTLYFIIPSYRYRKELAYQSEYSLNFNERNLKFKTGEIDTTVNWDYYKRVCENKNFYFLVSKKNTSSIIPKRAFTNQDITNEFRSLVESKLGKIKQK